MNINRLLFTFLLVVCELFGYSGCAWATQSSANDSPTAYINKYFSESSITAELGDNPSIYKSKTALFRFNLNTNHPTSIIFKDVKPIGKVKNIPQVKAHDKAIAFIQNKLPFIDLKSYTEESSFKSNYVLRLQGIDKASGIKLLNSVGIIINQETGEIAQVYIKETPTTADLNINISKNEAQKIAEQSITSYLEKPVLVKSSDVPEVKIDRENGNKQRAGWIFIFKSQDAAHSSGVLVDITNGETLIQAAY